MLQDQKNKSYIEDTLEFIKQKVYEDDDNELFEVISRFLAKLFNVDSVLINKYSVEKPKITETVKIYNRDCFIPNISYDLKNTPCENVINKTFCVYPNNVQARFPKDKLLAQMNVDSYIGTPLWSSTGQPIGLLALLDSKPLKDIDTIKIILQIVSLKVEQILEKKISENVLELQVQHLLSSKEKNKKSEDKFRNIVENSSEWIWELDKTGVITYSNTVVEQILGYKSVDLLGKNNIGLIHKTDRSHVAEIFLDAVKQKKSWKNLEFRWTHKNGGYRYFESSAIPILNKEGVLDGFRGVTRDITERKKSEGDIKQLDTAINNSVNEVYIYNAKSLNITYVNKRAIDNSGYSFDELMAMTPLDVKSKYTHKSFLKLLDPLRKDKVVKLQFRTIHQRKDKTTYPVEVLLNKFELNSEPYYLGVIVDITELKKSEEETKKLSTAVEQSANSVIITDTYGKVEYVNHRFTKVSGYTQVEVLGEIPRILYSGKHNKDFYIQLWKTISTGKTWKGQFQNKAKDGRFFWEQATVTPIKNEEGEIVNFLLIKEDITSLKEAEKKMIDAKERAEESDNLKTEFLNNMSHEIRTPMNGILGFSDFLSDANLSNEKRKNYVQIIQNSGDQLLRIIDDILEISRLETKQVTLKEEKTNLNDFLFELFAIFDLKAKGNQISLYLEKGLSNEKSVVLIDSIKLHKVLSNLLENALKFTNQGQINFGYQLKDKRLKFFVRDTGIGIPKGKIKIIFERFSQGDKELSKKIGGLGLGLSIAKENIILLGGDITVESKMMAGSTFKFDIPFKPSYSGIEIHEKDISDATENKLTFLIVEDEEVNFMFIEILLLEKLKIKCHIIHAINGKEAVKICKTNEYIDLVLMDLKMPVMNGFEATELIKEFRPDLPIIAQSAYTSNEDRKRAEDAGCIDFISKPITKETLTNALSNFIKR
jgi:PAS domain S-box-containing protein